MVQIRNETEGDVLAIEAVTTAAFLNAPHTDHTEQFIVRELRAAGSLTVSLLAEEGGVIIGHVAVSPVTISDGSSDWYGLGPISVAPERQGEGIGTALMHAALDALRECGAAGCVVLGEPAYYGRFGFKATPELVLPGVPAEYFQTLMLGGTNLPDGIVSYHLAFDATE